MTSLNDLLLISSGYDKVTPHGTSSLAKSFTSELSGLSHNKPMELVLI